MDVAASVAAVVDKARTSWLKNSEVLELLEGFEMAGLSVCQEPPVRPAGGQLFLFDRRICRFFRRDGHNWRKKPDGKTIRETHEKLKVGNSETLNCYYAHADSEDGLQRRCYWQLDPEKEHIVLVHYLCCASSRAGAQRAASVELSFDTAPAPRPQRSVRANTRRAYSPPARDASMRRRGSSQTRLSPLTGNTSSSLEDGSVDVAGDASGDEVVPLPLVQGMSLEAAAALPSLAQQYAMQQQAVAAQAQQLQAHQLQAHQLHMHQLLQGRGSATSGSGSVELDPFVGVQQLADHARPLPGVLYTDQRVATQLAAAQQAQQAAQQPVGGLLSPTAGLPPRPLHKQESFTAAMDHKALFREMSLGIQRDAVEEGFFLGSPTSQPGEHDPLAGDAKGAAATPATDLASLLASPPHGGAAHRRSFSRQGSGLSRLISKNWEADVLDLFPPDVDADITAYPVNGVVVEVAERPSSPGSRLFDHAGIAFFGSAHASASSGASNPGSTGGAVAVQSALEPSPLGVAGLEPLQPDATEGPRAMPSFGGSPLGIPLFADSPTGAELPVGSPASLQFAAGEAHALAQRTAVSKGLARACGGMPRAGSYTHLSHLAKRAPSDALAVLEEQRRKERVDAAAVAAACFAQGHRDEKLAAVRSRRAAGSLEAEDPLEMIDVPENIQRLSSFMQRGSASGGPGGPPRTTLGRELAATEAVADLEQETRSLLKHMSIDEVDAVAAVRDAQRELDVMPTIHAAPSSDVDAASHRDSLSEELGSRAQSVNSLLDGMQASAAAAALGNGSLPLDPIAQQLQVAMAQHAARQAR